MSTISIEALNELFEYSKVLKCDITMVVGGKVYGTDNNFIHLRTIESNLTNECPDMIFYLKDLTEFMKQRSLSECDINIKDIKISDFITMHYEYIGVFNDLISSVNRHLTIPVSFSDEYLRNNEDFNTINIMKAKDGIGLLKLSEKYILTIYNGLLPINKDDKIEIYIRDISSYRYLANFTIVKKKFTIDLYFMYLFLN
ncbi:MAG: hypothetical protein M0P49_06945 [Bacilli bacterium]|nr:hypothetical protein [Bacilli bacterium]